LGNGDGSFHSATAFAAGTRPVSVVLADLDGDTIPDVVTANNGFFGGGDDVSVLLGNGDGTFRSATAFEVGFGPSSVAIADFDGDTIPDLVAANISSEDVSVLLGNGDGTFQSATDFVVGDSPLVGPISVAVADFDGDMILDLVTANVYSNNVSVLMGNGDGSFQPAIAFVAGDEPRVVVVADLDGDEIPDVVSANFRSADVSVLLGNGDGTFQPATAFFVGGRVVSVAVADLDGDMILDLVTANIYSNNVSVLQGNGDGTFQAATAFAVGDGPQAVVVADLNGDAMPDLVTANSISFGSEDDVSVLLGNGDGTFQSAAAYVVGNFPISVAVADLDGDTIPDLVTASYASNNVSVLINLGDPPVPTVGLDIRPRIDLNFIHPMSRGKIPVAILGSETFDVGDIARTTLAFGPSGAASARRNGGLFKDVNHDGLIDLVTWYRTEDTGIAFGDTEACVEGELLDGTLFAGCDAILTVPVCGMGFELVFILPPLIWAHGRRRRSIH